MIFLSNPKFVKKLLFYKFCFLFEIPVFKVIVICEGKRSYSFVCECNLQKPAL